MSDDLSARLALLASEEPEYDGDQRVIRAPDRFAALLHVIDQTVIPAVLEVTDGTSVLTLDVAGRRLSRLPGQVEDLSADNEDALAAATAALTAFADAGDGPLKLRELASDQGDADPTNSVSIGALAGAAGRPMIDPNAPPLDQFKAHLGTQLLAGLQIKAARVTDRIGDADGCKRLEAAHAGLVGHGGDGPALMIFSTQEGAVSGAVVSGDEAMLFAVGDLSPGTILALFGQVFPS